MRTLFDRLLCFGCGRPVHRSDGWPYWVVLIQWLAVGVFLALTVHVSVGR